MFSGFNLVLYAVFVPTTETGNKLCILVCFIFLRVDERSSDSYIGRDSFFGKVLKFVQAQIHFFTV